MVRFFLKTRRGRAILIGLIMLLGIISRFLFIWDADIDSGEMTHIAMAGNAESFKEFFQRFYGVNRPFLWHHILHLWIRLTGTDAPLPARTLTVIFSILTIPLLYRFGKLFFGRGVCMFALVMFALAPIHVHYSQLIIAYPLLVLMVLLSVYSFTKLLKGKSGGYWYLYLISTLSIVYIHYYGFWVIIFQNMVVFFTRKRRYGHLYKRWLLSQMALLALSIPCFYTMFHRIIFESKAHFNTATPLFWRPELSPKNIILAIPNVFFGFSFLEELRLMAIWKIIRVTGVLMSGLFLFLGFGSLYKNRKLEELRFLLFYIFGILLISFPMVFIHYGKYAPKHFTFLSPAVYLVMSAGILSIRRAALRRLAISFILICAVASLTKFYTRGAEERPHWREGVEFIQTNYHSREDIIFVYPPGARVFVDYLSKGKLPTHGIPKDLHWPTWEQHMGIPSDLKTVPERIGDHNRIWLFLVAYEPFDPNRVILNWFDEHYQLIEAKRYDLYFQYQVRLYARRKD